MNINDNNINISKKEKILSNIFVLWLVGALCCALWGSAFPFIKLGYSALSIMPDDTGSIILFAGIRFFLAGVLTIIIFSFVSRKPLLPTRKSLPSITILSLFQTVLQYLFFYLGLARTTGDKASIINGVSCVFALAIACLIFRTEKLTPLKLLASVFCVAGVVVSSINFTQLSAPSFNIGDSFILLSSLSYAFSSVFMKKFSASHSPYMLSGYQFVFGGVVMIVAGVLMHGSISFNTKGFAILLYLSLVSAVAYSLWGLLLKYNPVSRVAVCGAMTPAFGYFLSVLLLGGASSMLAQNFASLLLVIIGIIIINI